MKNDIEARLESIESLLRLMFVNNIISDLGKFGNFTESKLDKFIEQDKISEDELVILNDLNIEHFQVYSNNLNRFVIIFECDKFELNRIRDINKVFKKSCKNLVPVFCFNKLVGTRKSKLLAEKISYIISGKEININFVNNKLKKK